MWAVGEVVQDRRTGKTGEVIQVTGPAPFIYRVKLYEGEPPIVIYRYGDQLRHVPTATPARTE
ncbi:hypothetical protein FM076_09225 [Streptomyces albus subsp. chlorinus]|uniref:hypothetical protein n=1 Tax=Streptomyces albus TaxID=1888 RepID=UPI00156D4FEF|nr:hypothetical protein [Streptomyces albus]NSC21370.1 hypothetical protein [Streptomyces albus subsp. chlorinus]NSC21377.1 hypothetical protein [Streptomyces albus subsp. chlorinus]